MKKILLLGGTGAMGAYLAPECLARGYEVHVTSRRDRMSGTPGLHFMTGNARDLSFVRQAASSQPFDAIVDFMIYDTPSFAARAEELLSLSPHYIFISTYRVFANSGLTPLTETSPRLLEASADAAYLRTDEYALTKARQEDVLRRSSRKNWTIVRPAVTYSTARFQFGTLEADMLLPRARDGIPVAMASAVMDRQATMTWAGDVARMIGGLILNEQAYGEDFNVVTTEHRSWREIAGYYGEHIGLTVREVPVEKFMSLGGNPWQLKYDRLYDRVCDNAKILSVTGIAPDSLMTLRAGLAFELAKNAERGGDSYSSFTRAGGRMDRLLKIRRCARHIPVKDRIPYIVGRHALLDMLLSGCRAVRRVPGRLRRA